MKKNIQLTESELVSLIKRVISEQSKTESIPQKSYKLMISGAKGFGTNPKKIVDAINMITTSEEFYQLNDMFKDKKTGYSSFDEMIRGEFEYTERGAADDNWNELNEIAGKLKKLGVQYNFGKKNELKNFTISPKPVAPKNETTVVKDWDKVKNYLLTNGFPENFSKGELGKNESGEWVRIKNKDFTLVFWDDGEVTIRRSENARKVIRKWSWDGTKPVIEGGYLITPTKKAVGYAKTEEDILTGNKILGLGSNGDLVKRIQYEIFEDSEGKNNPGCKADAKGPKDCDGIYGPLTKKGVLVFQKENSLIGKDGIVGNETWQFMNPYDMDYVKQ